MNLDTKDAKPPSSNGYELPKKVAILHSDVKREYFPTDSAYLTEKNAVKYAQVIAAYIQKMGITTHLYPGNAAMIDPLKQDKPELVINLVDTFQGSDQSASFMPAVLEVLGFPYTGAGVLGVSLCSNKFLVSDLLAQNGVPVPKSQLFNSSSEYLDPTLRFPLIAKLNETHGSVEINQGSIAETEKHLRERLKYLLPTYKQPVLVQEFIVGREISAVLLEGLNKKVYLSERILPEINEKYRFVSFELKWLITGPEGNAYQKYEDPILREYIKKAFSVTGMYDYGRFDVRLDNSGRYFFLDANSNPFLGPKEVDSGVGIILDMYGVSFEETLRRLLINTVRDSQGKERLPLASEHPRLTPNQQLTPRL